MHTMIDWRYRLGTEPAEKYRIELGLFKLRNAEDAGPRWAATSLVDTFRQFASNSQDAVGSMSQDLQGLAQ